MAGAIKPTAPEISLRYPNLCTRAGRRERTGSARSWRRSQPPGQPDQASSVKSRCAAWKGAAGMRREPSREASRSISRTILLWTMDLRKVSGCPRAPIPDPADPVPAVLDCVTQALGLGIRRRHPEVAPGLHVVADPAYRRLTAAPLGGPRSWPASPGHAAGAPC